MNVLDILNSPWAITPDKLAEICAIYAAHRDGEKTDLAAVEAAIGKSLGPGGAKPYDVQNGVAVVPLEGVLAKRMSLFSSISGGQSYQSFQQELQQALDDPDVKAIILSIDSPGGTVDGVQAAADAVYAARDVKPIYAFVDGQMCSAAYLIGSSASQAYIGSDFDVVGSIGVVTQHIDTSAAEYMRGVKVTDITAGKYKRIASQHAPLSPEGRSAIQDQLDHMYSVFVDAVARNRGVNVDTVLSRMADGRIFTGQKAIDAGLVDGKMTLTGLMQKMQGRTGTLAGRRSAPNHLSVTKPVQGNPVLKSKAEMQVDKLRVLLQEEKSSRRLLETAESMAKTARVALAQANRTHSKPEELLPYTRADILAAQTVRHLRERLRINNEEQLAVLHG